MEIPRRGRLDTARSDRSLLRGSHGKTLATLGAPTAQHLAASAGLLARAKPMRAFAALVMRLIRALHGSLALLLRSTGRYSTPPPEVKAAHSSDSIVTRRIFTIVARTAGDPATMINAVRDAIRNVERDQPITELGTMRDVIGSSAA